MFSLFDFLCVNMYTMLNVAQYPLKKLVLFCKSCTCHVLTDRQRESWGEHVHQDVHQDNHHFYDNSFKIMATVNRKIFKFQKMVDSILKVKRGSFWLRIIETSVALGSTISFQATIIFATDSP